MHILQRAKQNYILRIHLTLIAISHNKNARQL